MSDDTDREDSHDPGQDVAIIGLAAHLPGAPTVAQFWRNLCAGVESIETFSDEELIEAGVAAETLRNPHYVKRGAPIPHMEDFDAEFFGFNPKDAAITDPQHRHFLECVWEALEDAGYPPERCDGPVGVFAGCGMASYMMFNLLSHPELVDDVGLFLLRHTGNDKDFLATRASYVLDLKGPSINVQTACSTSLVATHVACQHLLSGECDFALAGGSTIEQPHRRGYIFKENEILAPDGHCRSFDHRAEGTVFGSGTGVVVLRRLADAREAGDRIYAVIKGSAVNNDGSQKVSYLAPSVEGQVAVVSEAIGIAGITADTIDFVEAHGTGTPMGDPIEISALTQAFRETTDKVGYCAIASAKTNIGHLDTAAGVAGLIKAALCLYHRELPASLHYEAPNPMVEFEGSPFFVNDVHRAWKASDHPRRAAVNSLGVGGTNAHVILEEPPARAESGPTSRSYQLLTLSARNRAGLDDACDQLADHLAAAPEVPLADVAHTLMVGRRAFDQRRVLACRDHEEAIALLRSRDARRVLTHTATSEKASVVFMLPGGGAQYVGMGAGLYENQPVFREHVDRGLAAYQARVDYDLRQAWFGDPKDASVVAEFERPAIQLPAIFILEYALAQLWMSWGVRPRALIGHSLGENTAACLAGTMSFEDCLGLVVLRGTLFERVPAGGMLSVALPRKELEPLLDETLDLATVNSPGLCAVSGPAAAIETMGKKLESLEIDCQRIPINIAAHSRMLEPILADFHAYLASIPLHPPELPFISNRTGDFITPQQATDPTYWVEHLRNTVMFSDGVKRLLEDPNRVFLEVGPGKTLGSLVRQQPEIKPVQSTLSSLRHPEEDVPDSAFFATALGRAWASGADVDLGTLFQGEERRHVSLPTYPFQRRRYFYEPGDVKIGTSDGAEELQKVEHLEDWYYAPVWKRRGARASGDEGRTLNWLVFLDESGVGEAVSDQLRRRGHQVVTVTVGDTFYKQSDEEYVLAPEQGREGYEDLLRELRTNERTPDRIAHLWMLTADESFRPGSTQFHRNQEYGFYSLLFLAQAAGSEELDAPLHIAVVSNGMQQVENEPLPHPEKATLLGPVRVIPREFPGYTASSLDVVLPATHARRPAARRQAQQEFELLVDRLVVDLLAEPCNATVAYRGNRRFEQTYEQVAPEIAFPGPTESGPSGFRASGVYLITGGMGGLGTVVAEHIASTVGAKLVLLGRTGLPERSAWKAWISRHGPHDPISVRIAQVRRLEKLGAEVMTVAASVMDIEQLRNVAEAVERRFGAVNGIIHAAGVLRDDLIQIKSSVDIEEVFAPKVHGTRVIESAFAGTPLDFIVLFSSTSSVIAPAGQVDYVAANAFLNAHAQSQPRTARRTVAINWGVWNEVGMAADAAAAMGAPPSVREEVAAQHPLFDQRIIDRAGGAVLTSRYSPSSHWVFDEHRTAAGHAVMPGTGYLELARAALREHGDTRPFEIRDFLFLRPLYVADGTEQATRVRLRPDEGAYGFDVQSERRLDDGRVGWETHAEAELHPLAATRPEPLSLSEIEARCDRERTPDTPEGLRSDQEEHLRFGPRWRVLRQVSYGEGEALARLELPSEFQADLDDYLLHPGLLDFATGFGMRLIEGYPGAGSALWVPLTYGTVRVHGPLPRRAYSWARNHGKNTVDGEFARFDVTITDRQGNVVVEVENFTIKRLAGGADFAVIPAPSASELEFEAQRFGDRQLSPAEAAFHYNLQRGISPAEGMEALDRILVSEHVPQVVVSSLDLFALQRQAEVAIVQPDAQSTKFARPDLDSEFVEPRDDVEKALVGIWQELLGLEVVGVEDSFFDLGGHSLIAVRLFARIKKIFEVEYAISVLFEAPTIAQCAALIREETGLDGEESADASADDAAQATTRKSSAPKLRYLVPMHEGRREGQAPFFLVAGMFGNVLNLRHLAHHIGVDRPFYGIQARGLHGEDDPHEEFGPMARDYLQEVRSVQPHGPYYIGGFSGGGMAAYEMAHQLILAGEEVGVLVLLDTPLHRDADLSFGDKLKIHSQEIKRRGFTYVSDKLRNRYQRQFTRRETNGEPRPELTPAAFRSETIRAAFDRACHRYVVPDYPGVVTLFRPRLDERYDLGGGRVLNHDKERVYADNGWGSHVHKVDVCEVPGDHDGMVLEPNVRVLASELRSRIAAFEARSSATLSP